MLELKLIHVSKTGPRKALIKFNQNKINVPKQGHRFGVIGQVMYDISTDVFLLQVYISVYMMNREI